ncbi:MAG: type II secretion system protein N, partial [Nevskiales bacterium]
MKRVYLAAGLAGLLLFLLAYIPAPLLYHWGNWGPQTQALGLSGNLWRGQAASVSLSGIALRDLQWRWRPQALLIGRFSHRVTAQTDGGSLEAVVSSAWLGNTLRISALHGSLPVEQLGPSLQLPVLPVSGSLQFGFKRLHLRAGKPWLAEGELDFHSLVFSFSSPPAALGNYHAIVNTVKQTIQLQLSS